MASDRKTLVCDVCGKEYPTPQGLGSHRRQAHGITGSNRKQRKLAPPRRVELPEVPTSAFVSGIRAELEGVAAPLVQKLREVEDRLAILDEEGKALRETRTELRAVIGKLAPSSLPAKPATSSSGIQSRNEVNSERARRQLDAKVEDVERLLSENVDRYAEGFTSNRLADDLSDQVRRGLSTKTARTVLEELRERGVVRHDRVVKGGGMSFKLVSADEVFYSRERGNGKESHAEARA